MNLNIIQIPDNEYTIRIDKYRIYFPAAIAKNKKYVRFLRATDNPNTYAFEFSNTEADHSLEIRENNTFYVQKSYYKNIELPEGKYKAKRIDEKLLFQMP